MIGSGYQHFVVYFGRIKLGAADEIPAFFAVKQCFERLAYFGLVFFQRDALLCVH